MRAVILGGPGEGHLAAEIAALMSTRPALAAERLSFEQTLALVRGLRLLVTTHSALMHAANAFDVPFVALCGISDMDRDGPYRPVPERFAVVKGARDDSDRPEDEPSPAMLAITEAEVTSASEALLRRIAHG
jgi:ADP-heptose:LPS heptosyltransferase